MTAIASRSPAFFVLSNAPPRDLSPCGTNDDARNDELAPLADEHRVALSDVITDTLPVSLASPKRQPRAVFALPFRADVRSREDSRSFPRGNSDPPRSGSEQRDFHLCLNLNLIVVSATFPAGS